MASGSTGNSASMRSSTPPCPGNRPLESLTPAWRFSIDSNRSPTTLNTTSKVSASSVRAAPHCASSAEYRVGSNACKKSAAAATIITTSQPPIAPSQVLPGLMAGASLCFPNAFPEKYAPISASHTNGGDESMPAGDEYHNPGQTQKDARGALRERRLAQQHERTGNDPENGRRLEERMCRHGANAEPRACDERKRGHQRVDDRGRAAQLEQARPFPGSEHD